MTDDVIRFSADDNQKTIPSWISTALFFLLFQQEEKLTCGGILGAIHCNNSHNLWSSRSRSYTPQSNNATHKALPLLFLDESHDDYQDTNIQKDVIIAPKKRSTQVSEYHFKLQFNKYDGRNDYYEYIIAAPSPATTTTATT